jgi:hypothetical protein
MNLQIYCFFQTRENKLANKLINILIMKFPNSYFYTIFLFYGCNTGFSKI